jgi:hypothetical protein
MINLPTGDVEAHLAARVAQLDDRWVAVGARRNVYTAAEPPPDGAVGAAVLTVELTTGRNGGGNSGSVRAFDLQLLYRYDRAAGSGLRSARSKALSDVRALYDLLHRSGTFVARSGERYVDVIAIDVPVLLEDRYVSLNVTMHRDG